MKGWIKIEIQNRWKTDHTDRQDKTYLLRDNKSRTHYKVNNIYLWNLILMRDVIWSTQWKKDLKIPSTIGGSAEIK